MKARLLRHWDIALLVLILASALAVRLIGICRGLPYVYYSDEAIIVNHAMAFGSGDLNPHDFTYPSLYMYVLFFIYGVIYVIGWVARIFTSTDDFVRLFFTDATLFYLPGRLIAAFAGVISVWAVYSFGRRIYNTRVGLVAAAFLSFSVLHVTYSHYVKTHVPAGLLVIIGLYLAWSIYEGEDTWRRYLIAGIVTGLAASTIYHAGFILISIVVAHILGWRDHRTSAKASLWSPKLLLTFVSSFIAFVLATPFALFDWRTFIGDLTSHGTMFYSGGYWEHGVFYPFTSLITSIGPPLGYLALVSLVYVLIRRRSADLILASQPLFLGAFLMMFKVKEPQHMLIAFPALAILSALFLTEAVAWIVRRPVLQAIALGLATAVVIASPARASYQSSYLLSLPDTRTVAKDWIEKNVPFNSKLVMDSGKYYLSVYGPPLRMSRWTLEGFIARSKSPAEGTLARREGTRRVGYSGEAEYFRKQLQTLGDEPAYDIVQILHDPGSTKTDVLTMQEYIAMGVQYAIVSSKAQESYTPDSEQAAKHPDKAAKYRDFYQSLASHATLLKDFNPSADIAGPGLQIYKLQ